MFKSQIRSDQVKSKSNQNQVRSSQISQIKSSQIESSQIESGQVSGHLALSETPHIQNNPTHIPLTSLDTMATFSGTFQLLWCDRIVWPNQLAWQERPHRLTFDIKVG